MCLTEPNVDADDLYQVLGVHAGATSKEISAAYKRLALRYHPDKNPDNRDKVEHAFKRVTCAYETLRDSAKRQEYDSSKVKFPRGPFGDPCNLGSFERADDLYRAFFGGAGGGGGNVKNLDIAGIFNFDCKPKTRQAKAPVRPVRPPHHLMLAGTTVVIHSLGKMPEYNRKSAKVQEWISGKGRYEVALSCGSIVSLRPQNLTQLCHVTVGSPASHPELHGKCAEIVDFNAETGNHVLLLNEPPCVVELPRQHCIFPVGTPAVLHGLSDDDLNGQMCSIVAVDHNASRYMVQCEGGRQVKVRFEKAIC